MDLKPRLKQIHSIYKIILIAGVVAASVFGYIFLIKARGDCGVVRFYEYAFGVIGLALWLFFTGIGLLLLVAKNKKNVFIGAFLVIIVNLSMILVSSSLVYNFLKDNFYFTDNDRLIELVDRKDDRLAALELGKRKVKSAAPMLCRIMTNRDKDINLRFNALYALREIVSAISKTDAMYENNLSSHLALLKDRRLRGESAKTLGVMGDKRSVPPLLEALRKEEDEFVKIDFINALGEIGDRRAYALLKALLDENKNAGYPIRSALNEALAKIQSNGGRE